jgi:hypothetical protein
MTPISNCKSCGLCVVLTCKVVSENARFLFRPLVPLLPILQEVVTSGNAKNFLCRQCICIFVSVCQSIRSLENSVIL